MCQMERSEHTGLAKLDFERSTLDCISQSALIKLHVDVKLSYVNFYLSEVTLACLPRLSSLSAQLLFLTVLFHVFSHSSSRCHNALLVLTLPKIFESFALDQTDWRHVSLAVSHPQTWQQGKLFLMWYRIVLKYY